MSITDLVLSLVVLVPMGAVGVALLWRFRLGLDPLEQIAYGVPFGWVLSSLGLLGICILQGRMSALVTLFFLVFLLALTLSILVSDARISRWLERLRPDAAPVSIPPISAISVDGVVTPDHVAPVPVLAEPGPGLFASLGRVAPARLLDALTLPRISWLPTIVFGAILLVWAQFWTHVIQYEPDLSFAFNATHFTADWPLHLGDVASIVYGQNIPMEAPRFAGEPYAYHYLSAFTAASIVVLGVLPGYALAIHSWVGLSFCLLGVYAFARRIFRRTGPAVLGTVLFFLGGSFAWLQTVRTLNASGDVWDTLRHHAWDFAGYDLSRQFEWNQVLAHQLMAQRAFLYGLPLFLLIVTLLWVGLRRGSRRLFLIAALVTATLPYANSNALLVLALTLPVLALVFPARALGMNPLHWPQRYPMISWLVYAIISVLLIAPQIYLLQGTSVSGLALSWSPGFDLANRSDSGTDRWLWYAVKNFGFLLVLIPLGLLIRGALPSPSRRILLAIMPLFVLAQLFTFQPLAGDNAKIMIFWYVAGAMAAAAAINALWVRAQTALLRAILVLITVATLLSGLLIHVEFLAQNAHYGVARADEIAVGMRVRSETFPSAVFATGRWHTNPVLMIGGRSVLIGWSIQVFPLGYDETERDAALREILQYGPGAESLIAEYGIDYVAISSAEIRDLSADPDAFAIRYPLAIEEGDFRIFAVSPAAIDLAVANGAMPPSLPPGAPTPGPSASVSPAAATQIATGEAEATRPPRP